MGDPRPGRRLRGFLGQGAQGLGVRGLEHHHTTGFVTADFDRWDTAAKITLVLLMFIGGCAGSTAGGIKVIRVLIIFRTILQDVFRMIHPRAVTPLHIGGRVVPETVRIAVLGLFAAWMGVFGIATFIVALQEELTLPPRPRRWRRH